VGRFEGKNREKKVKMREEERFFKKVKNAFGS